MEDFLVVFCVCVCVCVWICVCLYVYMCMYMCVYVCLCICVYMRVCVCVGVYLLFSLHLLYVNFFLLHKWFSTSQLCLCCFHEFLQHSRFSVSQKYHLILFSDSYSNNILFSYFLIPFHMLRTTFSSVSVIPVMTILFKRS